MVSYLIHLLNILACKWEANQGLFLCSMQHNWVTHGTALFWKDLHTAGLVPPHTATWFIPLSQHVSFYGRKQLLVTTHARTIFGSQQHQRSLNWKERERRGVIKSERKRGEGECESKKGENERKRGERGRGWRKMKATERARRGRQANTNIFLVELGCRSSPALVRWYLFRF